MTHSSALLQSERFRSARSELIQAILDAGKKIDGVRPPSDGTTTRDAYAELIREFQQNRGRDLHYPFVSSGLGNGPYVELMDGSVKLDMITGLGINFFGHAHPELIGETIDGLPSDIMQGNLEPGVEAAALLKELLKHVGADCRLKHAWYATCGTMVNELALKIIRQKHAPATKILAFADAFAGRSTAMQEVTDNPKYREGQPVYGEVSHLPFYSRDLGVDRSVAQTLSYMHHFCDRYPGKYAGMMIELVQGEGGFNYAPRDYTVRVFEEAKKLGLAIWADEVQTFARTGQLFAYQTFGLEKYVDVVTVAKALQACVVLYTEEYNPKPGLIAGTFTGSISALRSGRRVLEMLTRDGYFGEDGRIARLSNRFVQRLETMQGGSCKGKLSDSRRIGGMIAFQPGAGSMDEIKALLNRMFELGVVAFYCGHGPYLVRLLPPLGAMNEAHVDQVCDIIEKAIQ